MAHKYFSELYSQVNRFIPARPGRDTWFCREFAQRDIYSAITHSRYHKFDLTLRIGGLNMRPRYADEQDGMAKYARLLLPDNTINADAKSIWIDLNTNDDGKQLCPPREIFSLLLFYIKYLSIQMKDRVDFERVCKALIRKRHKLFKSIPDQHLGTALYFFSYAKYPKEMMQFWRLLARGNGPGTAMVQLAHLEDKKINVPSEATEFYYAMLEEWCSTFKKELQYVVNIQTIGYARFWYLPILIQDVYNRIYDGDGRYDNQEYSEDEW